MKRLLKKIIGAFALLLLIGSSVFAQKTLTFWTDQKVTGPIKIYYNGSYAGSITRGYSSFPGCYAYGCVTVTVKGTGNTWKAIAEDGTEWSSTKETLHAECTGMRLYCRSSSHTSNPPGGYTGNGNGPEVTPPPPAPVGAGIVIAAIAVASMEVILNSDLYVAGSFSGQYGGLEFGFRNNWNRHITFEQMVAWRYKFRSPVPHYLHTDNYDTKPVYYDGYYGYYYGDDYYYNRSNWGCNFRLIYNFFDRDRTFRNTNCIVNPYVGFGCDYMQNDGFFTSVVAGFTFGSRRVKLDCRYTYGYDFLNRCSAVNQLQMGLIVAYQYRKFGFFRKRR